LGLSNAGLFADPVSGFAAPLIIARLQVVCKLIFTKVSRAKRPKLALIGFVFSLSKPGHIAISLSP